MPNTRMRYCLCGEWAYEPAHPVWEQAHSGDGHGPATALEAAAGQCRRHQRIFPASRVMFCPRCGHATGSSYGHGSLWCDATRQQGEFHHCCPGSCELIDGPETDSTMPCHPQPEDYERWAAQADAAREKEWGR